MLLFQIFLILKCSWLARAVYQEACLFNVTGSDLAKNGKYIDPTAVAKWEISSSGVTKNYLDLSFEIPVRFQRIEIQLRLNKDVRIVAYNIYGILIPKFIMVKTSQYSFGEKVATKYEIPMDEVPEISRLVFQGLDEELNPNEIALIKITACPLKCPLVPTCRGECTEISKDGCRICSCPKGSPSTGCNGYNERDMHLLYELVQRRTIGCQFVQGYKRKMKPKTADICMPFNYPYCRFYKDVVIPRTEEECLKFCS